MGEEQIPGKKTPTTPTKSSGATKPAPIGIPEKEDEAFDPSLVSPQLAMIKKLSAKPKNSLGEEEDKNDPKSPLALCNDGQTSESQSSGTTDQESVSFQEKLVADGEGVDAKKDSASSAQAGKKGQKQREEENYVTPRPIWVARLPRPASEKYDDQKAQRERDQVLDEKIKGLTTEIDAMIKESQ